MVIVIEPSYDIYPNITSGSEVQLMQQIERAGRTCYKSEEKITEASALPFVTMIMGRNHGSVLEHSNFLLRVPLEIYQQIKECEDDGDEGMPCFLRCSRHQTFAYISGSLRSFRSFHHAFALSHPNLRCICGTLAFHYPSLFGDLPSLDHPNNITIDLITDFTQLTRRDCLRHLTATVKLVCDRGVSHEIVRNKQFITFSQESTRYCAYQKGKFGSQITVIRPCEFDEGTPQYIEWMAAMTETERHYMKLTNDMQTRAEMARDVLPNSLKTEIVITANLWEWREIFKQRAAPAAHPQMRQLMIPLKQEMEGQYPILA